MNTKSTGRTYWKIIARLALASLLLATHLATAAPPSPEAFGTLRTISRMAISPDGKQIAYFMTHEGKHLIRVLSLNGSDTETRIIGLKDGTKPSWIHWANNEQVLAAFWMNDRIGTTPITGSFIFTLNATSMEGKILIRPKGILRQDNSDVVDFLYDDPEHILMAFSNETQSKADLQRVNVRTGRHKRVKRGRDSIQHWYTDLRGEPRVGQGIARTSGDEAFYELTIRDADDDTWRSYRKFKDLEADEDIFGFTDNPNELVVGRYNGKPTRGLYIYNLTEQRITRELFHNDTYDASGVVLSGDGKRLLGASYVADETEIVLFDENVSALDKLRQQLPSMNVYYVDQSADGRLAIVFATNSSFPGAYLLLNQQTDEVRRLSLVRPGLPSSTLGKVKPVRYISRDDTEIPAYVTLPPGVESLDHIRNLPFIVLPHGGPFARDDRRFDNFAQFFATRGYGVLQMNFRGSTGYGKAFEDAGRNNAQVMLDDVYDGTEWLIQSGYADANRICIAGWSYGGFAALMGAIQQKTTYQCAISIAGVTDLIDMTRDMRRYRFGRYGASRSMLGSMPDATTKKSYSPARRADEIQIPVFLAHGELDQRVHFDQFERMRRALKRADIEIVTVEAEEEDHFFSAQENRQKLYRELDAFLAVHLPTTTADTAR